MRLDGKTLLCVSPVDLDGMGQHNICFCCHAIGNVIHEVTLMEFFQLWCRCQVRVRDQRSRSLNTGVLHLFQDHFDGCFF